MKMADIGLDKLDKRFVATGEFASRRELEAYVLRRINKYRQGISTFAESLCISGATVRRILQADQQAREEAEKPADIPLMRKLNGMWRIPELPAGWRSEVISATTHVVDSHYLTLLLAHGSYRQVFDPTGYHTVFSDGERYAVWHLDLNQAA